MCIRDSLSDVRRVVLVLAPPEHEVKAVLDEWRENKDHPAYVRKEAYDRFMKQRTAAVT